MKGKGLTVFLTLVLLLGLSLILYPSVADWWNTSRQSKAVAFFSEEIAQVDDTEYREMIDRARDYNTRLAEEHILGEGLTPEQFEDYLSQLDITGTGIMGYIDIQKIRCTLPIYHGTDDTILQVAIGHVDWTSLPIGGEGSHCVLSGHRGLPSARLFTDIVDLEEGDTFIIRTMNELLTYEVDQIRTVLPGEIQDLKIEKDKDLCTLVTCTPYGVNTHRLLVRGHRVDNRPGLLSVTAEGIQIKPVVVTPIVALPMILALVAYVMIRDNGDSPERVMEKYRERRKKRDKTLPVE